MKKLLKISGLVFLALVVAAIVVVAPLWAWAKKEASKPIVPEEYQNVVASSGVGEIEAKYLKNGPYEVAYTEEDAEAPALKFEIWYPKALETSEKQFPVIVYCNGTGMIGSRAGALFRHWATWGFIVVANDDQSSWSGKSADQSLAFLLAENERRESVFFGRVNAERVGVAGHSQGGVGVFNAITTQEHSALYKAAVPLSPTQEDLAIGLKWPYDLTKVRTPVLMLAGTGPADAKFVTPLDKMTIMYEKIPAPKAAARKKNVDHGETHFCMDGYVVAWFMKYLQDDKVAAKAFDGEDAELRRNVQYQDQRIDLDISTNEPDEGSKPDEGSEICGE